MKHNDNNSGAQGAKRSRIERLLPSGWRVRVVVLTRTSAVANAGVPLLCISKRPAARTGGEQDRRDAAKLDGFLRLRGVFGVVDGDCIYVRPEDRRREVEERDDDAADAEAAWVKIVRWAIQLRGDTDRWMAATPKQRRIAKDALDIHFKRPVRKAHNAGQRRRVGDQGHTYYR